jgi:DNA polymerase-1
MGLEPKKFSKLTGSPTADEKFLRPLKGAFPSLLLQYRELDKQQGTYAEPWLAFLHPDGYLRAQLDIGAKTGRMTASDPNVLAIPKHGEWGKVFRRAIRTARPGCVIASWDLSQIELRVLAEMSKDEALCAAFRDRIDIHSLTASKIWRIPIDTLQPQHRLPAKTTNFGIVMGIAGQGLADQMDANGISGWDQHSCDKLIQDWLKAYPRAAEWFQLNQAEAHQQGYVTGWGGKVFWLGGIHSTDKRVVSEAERQATALKVQGGAQYLIKRAMRRYWQAFHADLQAQGYIECLLQIHDELVFEMDEALIPAADAVLQECLCRTTPLSIPIESKGSVGRVWEGADWRDLA